MPAWPYPPITWRISATTTMAAAMNTKVATIERGGKRCGDQADDESEPPETIIGARIDKSIGDSGDAGDTTVEQHQQHGGEPDQRTADCC